MRRLTAITVFAIFLALPIWAQHGGGGRMAGQAGATGGRPSVAVRGGSNSPSGSFHGPSQPIERHPNPPDNKFRGRWNRRRDFRDCYGYNCPGYGYPWLGYNYPYYNYPYGWGNPDWAYDTNHEQDAAPDQMAQEDFEEQRMLRQRESYRGPEPYAPWPPPAPQSVHSESQEGTALIPATVLVFRDQRTQEIRNYAIFGQTLWNFAQQHIEKISLNEIDLPATVKANEERGVSFHVPSPKRSSIEPEQTRSSI